MSDPLHHVAVVVLSVVNRKVFGIGTKSHERIKNLSTVNLLKTNAILNLKNIKYKEFLTENHFSNTLHK